MKRLLLHLEWVLLGFTALTVLLTAPLDSFAHYSLLSILSLAAFAAMRFWLPTKKLTSKVLYTSLEFAIILLPFLTDSKPRFVPVLAMVAVIRSCQMFEQLGRLIVTGLAFGSFLLMLFLRSPSLWHLSKPMSVVKPISQDVLTWKLTSAFSFAMALVFVFLLVNALLAERQSREKLSKAHEQLRHYALRIEDQATLQERNRIAREIHDSLGHTLTAQSIQLDSALLLLSSDTEKTGLFLKAAKQLCTQALQEVRQSVAMLRSDPLQEQSLENAIATLVKEFRTTTTIQPDCTINLSQPLPPKVSTTIYRIVQEALTNITRHSEATTVSIQLVQRGQTLYLLVKDNGRGFNPWQNSTGFGLQGMRERTTALGGQFNLISQPGTGCLVTAQIPLSRVAYDTVAAS
jgi:signal transduction histidine kinase